MRDRIASVAVAAAVVALVAWSCWQRWLALTVSPFPVGIDGYFYPIQLRSLLEDGSLYYADFPLAFWLMTPFAAATDPIIGAKLAAAFYGALIALPAYGLGARLGGHRTAGLVTAVLATTSAGSMFLTIEFVKNGIGLTLALTAVWLVLRAADRPTRARVGVAIVAALAALLTHKMAGALVIVIGAPVGIAAATGRGALRGRRLLYLLGVLAGGTAVTAIVVLATSEHLATLVGELWTSELRWSAPALAAGRAYLPMGHEAAIGGVLGVLAALSLARPVRRVLRLEPASAGPGAMSAADRAAAWAFAVLAIAIAVPWLAVDDPQGLGFRLRIAAFVPMAACAAIVVRALRAVMARWSDAVRAGAVLAIALAIVLAVPQQRVEGRIVAHPAMVAAVAALAGEVPAGDRMIVPERHIMFMVTWYTRAPSRLRPEGVSPARRWRVMPLAFIGAGSPLDAALTAARAQPSLAPPIGTHPRHPNGLVLVREATWEWILTRLPPSLRERYARWPTI